MPIKNLTTKKFIAQKFRIASSSIEKAIGLMFSSTSEALVMFFADEQKIPLHMFFVPSAIDVLFLDRKFEVVDLKENFKPFTLYTSKRKAKCVIELPAGTAKASGTKIGDKISLFSVTIESNGGSRRIRVK